MRTCSNNSLGTHDRLCLPVQAPSTLGVNNIMNRHFNPLLEKLGIPRKGFHAFRRFRVHQLRSSRVPESLIQYWIGHVEKSLTDLYERWECHPEDRRIEVERGGLGFEVPQSVSELLNGFEKPVDGPNFSPNLTNAQLGVYSVECVA